jgi:restriction endonuclease Mrr
MSEQKPYDPSDPPLGWAQLSRLSMTASYRRQSMAPYLSAAVSTLYGGRQVDGRVWTPEQELSLQEQRLITPQEFRSAPAIIEVDARLLQVLDNNPERFLSLDWRQFEKLVVLLLEQLGYRAVLSPVGRDGGIDITADRMTVLGPDLLLVQCKRYGPDYKVSEPVVKQFCTEIDDRSATRGLIATTSTFTTSALKYIELKKYKVSGADRTKLREWIRTYLDVKTT